MWDKQASNCADSTYMSSAEKMTPNTISVGNLSDCRVWHTMGAPFAVRRSHSDLHCLVRGVMIVFFGKFMV